MVSNVHATPAGVFSHSRKPSSGDSTHWVTKNTFLELVDDEPEQCAPRPRAISDFTGTKIIESGACIQPDLVEPEEERSHYVAKPTAEQPQAVPPGMGMDMGELWGQQPMPLGSFSPWSPWMQTYSGQPPDGMVESAWASLGPMDSMPQQNCGYDISPGTVPGTCAPPTFQGQDGVADDRTTVMLRNIPNRYNRNILLQLLNSQGFETKYDFVYLPMDFRNSVNLGYAFVNLTSNSDAIRLMAQFQNFHAWNLDSPKVCEVSWAHPHQGLMAHVERYRNSPVMHSSMPDEFKPMVFHHGRRVAFPAPTKAIRAPKLRPVRNNEREREQRLMAS